MAVKLNLNIDTGDRALSKQISYSETGRSRVVEESVADSQTDYEVALQYDASACVLLYINSTQDMLMETVANGSGININLTANEPYVWYSGLTAQDLTGDLTSLFFTNASGSAATLDIEIVQDPTP